MKLDILVVAAHADDAELGCGGTIAKHTTKGKKVGVVDLTDASLSTRGDVSLRKKEADRSSEILRLSVRENLQFADGFFKNDKTSQHVLIRIIRRYQPTVILACALHDRHPDHVRAAQLTFEACFLSGLAKIETTDRGKSQEPWRPVALYHYIQSLRLSPPDFIVDVSNHWSEKMKAIRAYNSQFYNADSSEPNTYISSNDFLRMVEARGIELGHMIGTQYGEGFNVRNVIGVNDIVDDIF